MKPQTRRRILMITVGMIVALALVYGFLPKPVPVDLMAVKRGPLRSVVLDPRSRAEAEAAVAPAQAALAAAEERENAAAAEADYAKVRLERNKTLCKRAYISK